MLIALQLIGGLILLGVGADWLVRGASRLALLAGLTPLVIGLTVVAFGTSMPELITSMVAGMQGQGTIAITNIVGSNIGNIALILATGAIIRALPIQSVLIRRDLPVMILASMAFFAVLSLNLFNRLAGLAFLTALIGFTIWQIRSSRLETPEVKAEYAEEIQEVEGSAVTWPLWLAIVITIAGLGTLVMGGKFLVEGAITMAAALGVSDRVIGLTIVAIGTSLPELASTIVAVMRNEPDVAVGNVIGSNIFNVLFIGGVVGLVGSSGPVPPGLKTDLWIMILVSIVASIMLLTGRKLVRWEGALLLTSYIAYLTWLVLA